MLRWHFIWKNLFVGDFNIELFYSKRFSMLLTSSGIRSTISSFTRELIGCRTIIDNIFTDIPQHLLYIMKHCELHSCILTSWMLLIIRLRFNFWPTYTLEADFADLGWTNASSCRMRWLTLWISIMYFYPKMLLLNVGCYNHYVCGYFFGLTLVILLFAYYFDIVFSKKSESW